MSLYLFPATQGQTQSHGLSESWLSREGSIPYRCFPVAGIQTTRLICALLNDHHPLHTVHTQERSSMQAQVSGQHLPEGKHATAQITGITAKLGSCQAVNGRFNPDNTPWHSPNEATRLPGTGLSHQAKLDRSRQPPLPGHPLINNHCFHGSLRNTPCCGGILPFKSHLQVFKTLSCGGWVQRLYFLTISSLSGEKTFHNAYIWSIFYSNAS